VGLRRFSRRRRRAASNEIRYSRWDGTQTGFEVRAADVFAEMTDDLMYHGDPDAALRRMLQGGFDTDEGRVEGLREIMERIREARRERLENHDLGGVYDDIASELREVVDTERASLDHLAAEAAEMVDRRRREVTDSAVAERRMELDLMPPDLAGQVRSLSDYDFTSAEAAERFEALMERLREQLMQNMVDQMGEAIADTSPQELARMKDMLADLNAMLDQRGRGEEPDFEGFMDRYGDMFGENPRDLDELLEALARRMAAAQQMLNSMTPEQRAQLRELSDQLLEDLDLRWQVDQLGENLRSMFPDAGWEQSQEFTGTDPLDFASAQQMMSELGDLDQLENLLRGAASPGALAEADVDRARELVGDIAADSLGRLAELARMLADAGLIENREGRWELTARAIRRIGQSALDDLFSKLSRDRIGTHELERTGAGHERDHTTKPYEWGDPFNLHIGATVRNAVRRTGGGTPVALTPDDFEIERTESLVRSSTVLMLDLSLSMPMRDNFLPAKKVAMALHALITGHYPRDYLGIVGFSEVARELEARDLPEVSWDFVYGTNMQHGFQLARKMLARESGTKQIIMITDGEPTAHIDDGGEPFFSYPPVRETVDRTLQQVAACTREGIRINVFMLDATAHLTRFIEQITAMNGGRAFFTTPETLGDYVLVDFVEHKRRLLGERRSH
jgi:uncharacterized protein with von Willebrand factor type A (vWA) domain